MIAKLKTRPRAGALYRRLPDAPDGFSLFAHLSEHGTRPGVFYYERTDTPTIIVDRAAMRIETRGYTATLQALTQGGENVLVFAAKTLAAFVTRREARRLELAFPAPQGDDAEARLLAPSPLDALRAVTLDLGKESDAAVDIVCAGVIAYDFIDAFEDLPAAKSDPLNYPDNVFLLAETYVRVDPGAEPRAVSMAFGGEDADSRERAHYDAREALADLTKRCAGAKLLPKEMAQRSGAEPADPDLSDDGFAAGVDVLKERIRAGDVYQIVPSRSFRAPCADPFAAFTRLRALNPSPIMFFMQGGDHTLFGATPEPAVLVRREHRDEGGGFTVEVRPIAGTRPRGLTPDEDDRLEADMRLDEKELAEHMMLVDLGRNDVARVSEPGTRRVVKLLTVERYSHVMHLVSQVTGRLRAGLDCLHAAVACLNAGTLTGAPKLRAMQILREFEATKRGPYGGSVGYICGDGTLDTGIVIRSALVRGGVATVRAGAGVVYDSDPVEEARETSRKAAGALAAIADARGRNARTGDGL